MQWITLAICLLGLVLPGYLICRALRIGPAWAAAFPISALLITLFVLLAQATSLRLEFEVVGAGLLLVSSICLAILWHREERLIQPAAVRDTLRALRHATVLTGSSSTSVGFVAVMERWLPRLVLALVAVAVTITCWRCLAVPLCYPDTLFRWEWLARLMFEDQSLSFYPPRSPVDFNRYYYPDGIAPLVSSVYWWLYAGWGDRWPALSAVSVTLQLISAMGLTAHAARRFFGDQAQWYALLAMVASSALLTAFVVSLETGYTAIAVAGQLCFVAGASTGGSQGGQAYRQGARWVVVAALFAALGAMSRDYGPALAATGFCAILQSHAVRRYWPHFLLTFVALASPWYLRNFLLTGNPVYPLSLGGLFPVNAVLHGVLADYQSQFGWSAPGLATRLGEFSLYIFYGASLLIFAGVPLVLWHVRKHASLPMTFVIACLLWAWAIGSASSGMVMTGRVLAPGWVALSIAIGAACSWRDPRWRTARACWAVVAIVVAALCLLSLSAYPLNISSLRAGWRLNVAEPMRWNGPAMRVADDLNAQNLKPTCLLTDDAFLAVVLQQRTGHCPVSIWNPRVAFVFDPSLSAEQVHNKLIENGVTLVSFTPNSANNRFLARHRFYAEDSPHWIRIGQSNEPVRIYSLTPPQHMAP